MTPGLLQCNAVHTEYHSKGGSPEGYLQPSILHDGQPHTVNGSCHVDRVSVNSRLSLQGHIPDSTAHDLKHPHSDSTAEDKPHSQPLAYARHPAQPQEYQRQHLHPKYGRTSHKTQAPSMRVRLHVVTFNMAGTTPDQRLPEELFSGGEQAPDM